MTQLYPWTSLDPECCEGLVCPPSLPPPPRHHPPLPRWSVAAGCHCQCQRLCAWAASRVQRPEATWLSLMVGLPVLVPFIAAASAAAARSLWQGQSRASCAPASARALLLVSPASRSCVCALFKQPINMHSPWAHQSHGKQEWPTRGRLEHTGHREPLTMFVWML